MQQENWILKEPIEKGWTVDRKYYVTAADGQRYLLRVAPEARRERCIRMFQMQQKVAELDISMCKPLALWDSAEGVNVLQTWVDGEDAEQALPKLTGEAQYTYGLEAGRMLKRIHSIPAPPDQAPWEPRFQAKIDRNIKMYYDCPIRQEGLEAMVGYLDENRHLLAGRPQCFQHGDYHVGNMMIADGKLVIIDFDRCDFGDPWEEFNRIVWCAQASGRFASGMVDGYFDGAVPLEFWRLLALYISSNTLSSIPWAIPFGDGEVQVMRRQAQDVLRWYDQMQSPIPSWYKL